MLQVNISDTNQAVLWPLIMTRMEAKKKKKKKSTSKQIWGWAELINQTQWRNIVRLFAKIVSLRLAAGLFHPILHTPEGDNQVSEQPKSCRDMILFAVVHTPPPLKRLLYIGYSIKTGAAIRQCIHHPITATNPAPNHVKGKMNYQR